MTVETVKQWAEETLEEWLTGYTEVDPKSLIQYKVILVGTGLYRVRRANPIGDSSKPRIFEVSVNVEEVQ